MNQPLPASVPAVPSVSMGLRHWVDVYKELTKFRLTALVMVTAGVGFVLGSVGPIDWAKLGYLLVGTFFASAAASTFNQLYEIERDAKMPRTCRRPLPSGRISRLHAVVFAVLAAGFGVTLQAAMVNPLAAGLTLLTILIYTLIYTPLKPISTANTMVGSVVGAIPPMMGYAGAAGLIDRGAWVLFATLFVWQIPHFLALAWLYRKDYALGGYRMLPIVDPTGSITGRTVVMWSWALLPIGLASTMVGLTGYVYAVGSLILGAWIIRLCLQLSHDLSDARARRLFLATLVYLPVLMTLMVLDRSQMYYDIPLEAIQAAAAQPSTDLATPPVLAADPIVSETISR
ncbi:MAG: protoheme IX farnesyltransferase [Planctomycetes bacterium]|nr:protoheme IX farnesyltransferase [Planctomycetota bacterium]